MSNVPEIRFKGFTDAWEQRRLGEVYDIYSGQTPFRGDENNFNNPTTAWIKTTDLSNASIIKNEENISDKALEKLRLLPNGTVLVAMYGGFNQIGRTGMLTYPATINQAISALPPVDDVDPYFLITELNHRVDDWKIVAASSRKDPNITKKDVENFILKYPDTTEQSRIGTFFRTLDNTIAIHKRKLDGLQELKKAYLQMMFPQGGEIVPRVRFEGFTEPWQVCTLGDVVKNITTGKLDANAMHCDGEYDFYTSGVKKYRIDKFAFEGQAITIAGNGATVGYMHLADGKFNAYQRTYVLQHFLVDRQFLFCEISNKLPKKIAEEARAGNIPYIVMSMLTDLEIKCPVYSEEQTRIGQFFYTIDEQVIACGKEIEQLQILKKAYLQKMFN